MKNKQSYISAILFTFILFSCSLSTGKTEYEYFGTLTDSLDSKYSIRLYHLEEINNIFRIKFKLYKNKKFLGEEKCLGGIETDGEPVKVDDFYLRLTDSTAELIFQGNQNLSKDAIHGEYRIAID